jgi:membrane protease YdiL (CAAX protease family)
LAAPAVTLWSSFSNGQLSRSFSSAPAAAALASLAWLVAVGPRPIHILRDLLVAVAFLIVATGVLNALDHFVRTAPNQAIRNLLPQGPVEVVLFLATSVTAGFCEELIYRGYLQRQFTALTHTVTGGILLHYRTESAES